MKKHFNEVFGWKTQAVTLQETRLTANGQRGLRGNMVLIGGRQCLLAPVAPPPPHRGLLQPDSNGTLELISWMHLHAALGVGRETLIIIVVYGIVGQPGADSSNTFCKNITWR